MCLWKLPPLVEGVFRAKMLSFASMELHSCKPQVTCVSENFHNVNKARRTNEEAASKIHGCRPMRRPIATSKQQKNIYKCASAEYS